MKYNIDYLDTMISKLTFSTYVNNDVKALMYLNDEETYDHMNTINKLNATVVANYPFVQSVYVYNNHKKMYYSTFGDLYHKDAELDKVLAENPYQEAQNYIQKHYHISFSATVSDVITEYTVIAAAYDYTLANSSYRYVFGVFKRSCSVLGWKTKVIFINCLRPSLG